MSVVIRIETERGESLEQLVDANSELDKLIFGQGVDGLVYLGMVDLYGDTMFDRLQLPFLMEELRTQLLPRARTDDARAFVSRLIAMAERSEREGPHLYLWFRGD